MNGQDDPLAGSDEETAPPDPRIQGELESLNDAAQRINKLENELERAHARFRDEKAASTQRLSRLSKSVGKNWIKNAQPYYDLLRDSHRTQQLTRATAVRFQEASAAFDIARDAVALAERSLLAGDRSGATPLDDSEVPHHLDSDWQERLNQATAKFAGAKCARAACEQEHVLRTREYSALQRQLTDMQTDIPLSIYKAKSFYDAKDSLEAKLQTERQNVDDVRLALLCAKQQYRLALTALEAISNELHALRRALHPPLPPRTPGVGAEAPPGVVHCDVGVAEGSEFNSDAPSIDLDFLGEDSTGQDDSGSEGGVDTPQRHPYLPHPQPNPAPLPPASLGSSKNRNKSSIDDGSHVERSRSSPLCGGSPAVLPCGADLEESGGALGHGGANKTPTCSRDVTPEGFLVPPGGKEGEVIRRDDLVEGAEDPPRVSVEYAEKSSLMTTGNSLKYPAVVEKSVEVCGVTSMTVSDLQQPTSQQPAFEKSALQQPNSQQPALQQHAPQQPALQQALPRSITISGLASGVYVAKGRLPIRQVDIQSQPSLAHGAGGVGGVGGSPRHRQLPLLQGLKATILNSFSRK